MKTAFLAHPKGWDDHQIDQAVADLAACFASASFPARPCSGRDDWNEQFRIAGSWDSWAASAARRYDIIVCPANEPLGKATAQIVAAALHQGHSVLLWDGSAKWVKGKSFKRITGTVPIPGDNWKGWARPIGDFPDSGTASAAIDTYSPHARQVGRTRLAVQHVAVFVTACEDLMERCNSAPEAGGDFASSVMDTAQGMANWAEEHNHVTPKMQTALANMSNGVDRWLNRQ